MNRVDWLLKLDEEARAAGGTGLPKEVAEGLGTLPYDEVGEWAGKLHSQIPPTRAQREILHRMGCWCGSKKEAAELIAASKRGDRAYVSKYRTAAEARQIEKRRREIAEAQEWNRAEQERIREEVLTEWTQHHLFLAEHPELQSLTVEEVIESVPDIDIFEGLEL